MEDGHMDKQSFAESCCRLLDASGGNRIPEEKALSVELAGVRIFERPLIGFADASDRRFFGLRDEAVVGSSFLLPQDWLPGAKSVVSFFLPFTEAIRESNRLDAKAPSDGWLNARIEGQAFVNEFAKGVVALLEADGFPSLAPTLDKRFASTTSTAVEGAFKPFSSNWSERHVAYICGLGTFGLSRGFITEKGMAGRMTSVVTQAAFEPDGQRFSRFDENCIQCGKCIRNCPVNAISFEGGKDNAACWDYLFEILKVRKPYYGCGKCQVNVPCESRNPKTAAQD
ncbi:MAG: 4Fe-4S binding protein [Eggerthellaceae bacterium]|nr:4Fe-4S binding protein [Eggerthellaceae bacterium]